MQEPAKTLDIRGLTKTFMLPGGRSVVAVSDFNLRIEPGEFVTFLGPSGCGKTTVLRILAGLERADAGEILVDGRSIQSLPPHRRRVGMVFQNYALFPHMSVFENVAYSLRIRRCPDERVRSDVPAALKTVGLETMAGRLPGQLNRCPTSTPSYACRCAASCGACRSVSGRRPFMSRTIRTRPWVCPIASWS